MRRLLTIQIGIALAVIAVALATVAALYANHRFFEVNVPVSYTFGP